MRCCIVLLTALITCGCGPAQRDYFVEAETNETLVALNVHDPNEQKQLDSLEMLRKGQLATKRYMIPMSTHSYGRWSDSYQWIADMMVIKVDRSPVSLVLTKDPFTGSSIADQALDVSSVDGIKFALGVTITAMIEEPNAATYLSYYGVVPNQNESYLAPQSATLASGDTLNDFQQELMENGLVVPGGKRVDYVTYVYQARPLREVVEGELAAYVQARMAEQFGATTMDEGKANKTAYFDNVKQEVIDFYKKRGITITVLGSVKGLQYEDGDVQTIIDARFDAINSVDIAHQDEAAQAKTNARMVEIARADRDAAWEFLANYPAMRMQFEIDVRKLRADRIAILQRGWDGSLPSSVLPSSAAGVSSPGLLMQLPQAPQH